MKTFIDELTLVIRAFDLFKEVHGKLGHNNLLNQESFDAILPRKAAWVEIARQVGDSDVVSTYLGLNHFDDFAKWLYARVHKNLDTPDRDPSDLINNPYLREAWGWIAVAVVTRNTKKSECFRDIPAILESDDGDLSCWRVAEFKNSPPKEAKPMSTKLKPFVPVPEETKHVEQALRDFLVDVRATEGADLRRLGVPDADRFRAFVQFSDEDRLLDFINYAVTCVPEYVTERRKLEARAAAKTVFFADVPAVPLKILPPIDTKPFDRAARFLGGLNLQYHPREVQREAVAIVHELSVALKKTT